MALKLSAPVGDKKRITKPDPKTGESKFKPVKNAPADVELVRLMLKANGYSVEISTKCDAGLIKTIRDFQKKKLGFKKPDGIVDPGMRTWNAGLPKLAAQYAADTKIERVEVVENGKTKMITVAEFEAGQEELRRKLLAKANMMYGQAESWVDFCNEVENTRQGNETFLNALTEFAVSMVNDKTDPPWTPILNARSESSLLKTLVSKKKPDWKKVYKQDVKATKAYNKGGKAFKKFIDQRISTAGAIVWKLEVVREVSFAVVETYMTARLVATKGMSPAKAHAIAAASTEALKSSAGQLGEHLAGNNVTWDGAAKKVFIDSFIAGLAGAAGGKLTSKLSAGLADDLAKAAASKLSREMPKKAVKLFFEKFLKSKAGEAMVTEALKETIGLAKPLIEKGRPPNTKEIKESIAKILTAGIMSAGAGKALDKFSSGFTSGAEKFLKTKLAPAAMEGAVKKDLIAKYGTKATEDFIKLHGDAIYGEIAKQISGKTLSKYAGEALAGADGSQSASTMQKQANEAMRKDMELRKQIQKIIMAEAKRKMPKGAAAH
ncbi:peptidoglycan-binding protein [Leisingera aquaemixtae]|uniref:peptidoglycan-binding protein n=1 Tax=Leisingera TaxID=191028 RepID=UPI001C977D0A|nr:MULTISPECIES: peptidoglycan-binding protein [Leisingera]MBY6066712.1 peptidoglycan-binding protein [Leisingera aquaemixtae]MCB4455752.1 peptidoglycan-binding protein [Leisingera sp. McT4-56]